MFFWGAGNLDGLLRSAVLSSGVHVLNVGYKVGEGWADVLRLLCQWKFSMMSSAVATNVSLSSAKVLGCPHHSFCVFAAGQVIILRINLQRDIFQNLFAWLFMSILYFNEKTTSVFVLKWFPNGTNALLRAVRKLLIDKSFEFTKARSCDIFSKNMCSSRYLNTFWYFSTVSTKLFLKYKILNASHWHVLVISLLISLCSATHA